MEDRDRKKSLQDASYRVHTQCIRRLRQFSSVAGSPSCENANAPPRCLNLSARAHTARLLHVYNSMTCLDHRSRASCRA